MIVQFLTFCLGNWPRPLGRSAIYRLVASGTFPRPLRLGPRAIAWRWSDLEPWSATRAADRH
jgi:prophage regulatory protein